MSRLDKKSKFSVALILKLICILTMVIFIGSMFLDFWTYETISEEDHKNQVLYGIEPTEIDLTISIFDYVWFTEKNQRLFGDPEKDPDGLVNNYWTGAKISQNDIVGMPFLATVLILFTLIFFLLNLNSVWPSIMSLIAGVYSLLALLQDKAGVYKPWSGTVEINEGNVLMPKIVEKAYTSGISYNLVLIAAALLTVASFAVFVVWVIRVIKWFTVKEIHY